MSMVPEAHFDCLLIVSELDAPLNGVTRPELQRIAFLACLLSIYLNRPASEWGYKFANTGAGVAFSDHLSTAMESMLAIGNLTVDEAGRLKMTSRGRSILGSLLELQNLAPRVPCVTSASASMLAVPTTIMTDGLEQEPTTAASQLRDGPTMLLDEPHLHTLHAHFQALSSVHLPGNTDLLSPSVLWLTYMAAEKAESDVRRDVQTATAEVQFDVGAAS
jgi:hypothetical protein